MPQGKAIADALQAGGGGQCGRMVVREGKRDDAEWDRRGPKDPDLYKELGINGSTQETVMAIGIRVCLPDRLDPHIALSEEPIAESLDH